MTNAAENTVTLANNSEVTRDGKKAYRFAVVAEYTGEHGTSAGEQWVEGWATTRASAERRALRVARVSDGAAVGQVVVNGGQARRMTAEPVKAPAVDADVETARAFAALGDKGAAAWLAARGE